MYRFSESDSDRYLSVGPVVYPVKCVAANGALNAGFYVYSLAIFKCKSCLV